MNAKALRKEIKAAIKGQYVRTKDFEKLKAQVKNLKKAVAKLEKRGEPAASEQKAGPAKASKPAAEKKPARKPSSSANGDNLQRIKGIGSVLEKKLAKLGVTRYAQIAAWTQEDIDGVSTQLDFKGRIEREEWIKQAAELVSAAN